MSSCGFRPSISMVVLYVLAAGVVAACAFFCCCFIVFFFSPFVCFLMLPVVLRLVSLQRPWDVFCLVSAGVVDGFLFLSRFFFFALPLSLSPSQVWDYYM